MTDFEPPSQYGYAGCQDATYANVLDESGTNYGFGSQATLWCGQRQGANFTNNFTFLEFDTSGFSDTVGVAKLTLTTVAESLAGRDMSWTLYVAEFDFGVSISGSDYRTQAEVQALTPIGSYDASNLASNTSFEITLDGLVGTTPGNTVRLVLWSSEFEAGSEPTIDEHVKFEGEGVGDRPVLSLTAQSSPTISSVSPASKTQDVSDVDITVEGTDFQDGAAVTFSGTGITVNSTSFVDSTEVTANIDVASDATASERNVTVTNPDEGTVTSNNAFEVLEASDVVRLVVGGISQAGQPNPKPLGA